jgi:hypothetical protein
MYRNVEIFLIEFFFSILTKKIQYIIEFATKKIPNFHYSAKFHTINKRLTASDLSRFSRVCVIFAEVEEPPLLGLPGNTL